MDCATAPSRRGLNEECGESMLQSGQKLLTNKCKNLCEITPIHHRTHGGSAATPRLKNKKSNKRDFSTAILPQETNKDDFSESNSAIRKTFKALMAFYRLTKWLVERQWFMAMD
ncbi:hypothetical protein Y032_0084g1796 [Ancylostoma ceylanicum]|uniref:Uncharacterized protein n=1 Tax=Ancylostoma ceylanicum TaxID=53326 RepID=A0A016TQ44_9BILA|nr:hypothetical protein Y032_0084g1796 [Ancylostoma ceylanicum]